MTSTKQRALQVLEQHEMDVQRLRLLLSIHPDRMITLVDIEDAEEWAFTLRRWCHLSIMAKNKYMKKYEEIVSIPK